MWNGKKVFVAGHRGLVGSAVVRRLQREQGVRIVTRTRSELDLTRQADVERFFAEERPDCVILAAAKVGGIHANATYPADFIRDNLLIQDNVINAAHANGVGKFVFLGSSCIYPKHAPQPIPEEALLTGPLEPTNEWYALAKISGIKLCQALRRQYGFDAISLMPTNLYGPNDNYHPENSHVVPGLLRRMHEAREAEADSVRVWGSGAALREFMHVDDLADAIVFLAEHYSEEMHVNVGTGREVSIRELAETIRDVVGFAGKLEFGDAGQDGTPRKLVDSSRLAAMGWKPTVDLETGLRNAYAWYLENMAKARG
ncbi:GDP-L-fucose synthase [Pseudodesulfovibrio tunisiensis]|uniref:GDP-L-fucose synthase n=1 Tax=Pseudodesulfovibrio tunisiensis TaxID=463192 RepID=UPI001FB471BA|nr:GDP-L-fucose synthase [Pseudodesulfovibrio tunisiensis]